MPILTQNVASGTAYYTADNRTLRRTVDAAKKNSPYYKKKKAAMERVQIKIIDPSLYDPAKPDTYHDAVDVLSAEEKAAKYADAITQKAEDKKTPTVQKEELSTNGTTSAKATSSTGVLDGTLAIRLNGRLQTKDREWLIDPAMEQVRLDVTAEVRGLGGKATGAIVLGTSDRNKPAISVVVFGTYGVEDEEIKKRIVLNPYDWAEKGRVNIRYQVMGQVPTRAQAFALYDASKALNYATIVQALDAIEDFGEEEDKASADDTKAIIPESDLLDQALTYVKEEPVKSAVIGAAGVAVLYVGKRILS
jgi:hypothetical protein